MGNYIEVDRLTGGSQAVTIAGTMQQSGGLYGVEIVNTPNANVNRLPAATALSLGTSGTLDLSGGSQQLSSLSDQTPGSGGGSIINSSSVAVSLLTLAPTASTTFSGAIQGGGTLGTIALVISGSGSQTLAGSNTYSGNTTISAGTLQLAAAGALGSGMVTVNGGVLDVTSGTHTVSSLTIGSLGGLNVAIGYPLTVSTSANLFSGTINISGSIATLPELLMTYSTLGGSGSFSSVLNNGGALPITDTLSYTGGSVEVISAVAFSGSAVWTSVLSTSWGSSSNWSDANSLHGVPGLSGSNGHDTATFSNSGSQTSVNLTGMNPSLVALSFSSSNYTLSGGSLTLQSDLGMASISVNGGTQSIASLLTLAGTPM